MKVPRFKLRPSGRQIIQGQHKQKYIKFFHTRNILSKEGEIQQRNTTNNIIGTCSANLEATSKDDFAFTEPPM